MHRSISMDWRTRLCTHTMSFFPRDS